MTAAPQEIFESSGLSDVLLDIEEALVAFNAVVRSTVGLDGRSSLSVEELNAISETLVRISNISIDNAEEVLAVAEATDLPGTAIVQLVKGTIESPEPHQDVESVLTSVVLSQDEVDELESARTVVGTAIEQSLEGTNNSERVKEVITDVLASGSRRFRLGQVIRGVFAHKKLSAEEKHNLIRLVNDDPRVAHVGQGMYEVISLDTPIATPAKDRVSQAPKRKIEESIDNSKMGYFVDYLVENAVPGVPIPARNLLTFVKKANGFLSPPEINAFFVAVASDPRITPEEDGTFVVKGSPGTYEVIEDNLAWYSLAEWRKIKATFKGNATRTIGGKPLHSKRTFQKLTRGARIVNPAKIYDASIQGSVNRRPFIATHTDF